MGIPNNKKYTNEAIELYMRENYPEYTILMIEEPCKENSINLVRIPYFKKKEIPNIIEDIVSTYERP